MFYVVLIGVVIVLVGVIGVIRGKFGKSPEEEYYDSLKDDDD